MNFSPTYHDIALCLTAYSRKLLDDKELEAAICQWLADPQRPLLDVLTVHARLSQEQAAALQSSATRQATETCADPSSARLEALPAAVRRLLAPHVSDVTLASESNLETRPILPRHRTKNAQLAGLTPGDRFDVLQVHAQGGLGVVFLARDREIDRTVALKQIKPHWADDDNSRARFLLEARVTGRLEHPGIVPIYALGADATGRPYYAMRLIRGESLLDVIERFHGRGDAEDRQRMPELRKLLKRFVDVCNPVDYAHSKGVIHRDIKPANIMVGKFGETLVVDWGLAKVIGSDEDVALTTRMVRTPENEVDESGTRIGTTIGTPAYMSPEQAAGHNDQLGPATDVYSLGATLYQLLTGCLPHPADDDVGIMMARLERTSARPPHELAKWIPKPLSSICLKALALRPEGRYTSARALSDDIERWLADEPVRAHAEGWAEKAFRWIRNHRTLATSLAVGYLVATVAIVVGVIGWNRLKTERLRQQITHQAGQETSVDGSADSPLKTGK
jgi:tRNA A-37 threonylcarbamoyl transferase component Bud32